MGVLERFVVDDVALGPCEWAEEDSRAAAGYGVWVACDVGASYVAVGYAWLVVAADAGHEEPNVGVEEELEGVASVLAAVH